MSDGSKDLVDGFPVDPVMIAHLIKTHMDRIPPLRLKEMTYEDVVDYYIDEYPHVFGVKCGVCLRSRRKDHWTFIQVFLFEDDNLVSRYDSRIHGRLFEVDTFDEELDEAFGDHDVLFLES